MTGQRVSLPEGITVGPDGENRCFWHDALPGFPDYHDAEWGHPIRDDFRLFEKICLEGFQSGMSWLTILRKRDAFRVAFKNFDYNEVAKLDDADIERLMGDATIVRNKSKIVSTINNAKRALAIKEEFGSLAAFLWRFEPTSSERPKRVDLTYWNSNPTTPASTRLSSELKRRGWTFVGPTTIYAFMQAVGMVNDHLDGCVCRDQIEAERGAFKRPSPGNSS